MNKTNGKVYVGITKRVPEERWGKNGSNYKSTPHFYSAIQLYGWNSFEHIIIATDLTKEEACQMEIDLIQKYQSNNPEYGYNILDGGQIATMPQIVKDKLSIALRGNQNGAGHPCSEEKKKKISDAQKGRKLTQEHKDKLSKAKKGKTHTISDDTKKKISDSHNKKQVICVETGIVYPSIQQCGRDLGFLPTMICANCRGRIKSYRGFHFQYYDDVINA